MNRRALLWVGAIALALPGVIVYAAWPGVAGYFVITLLMFPLLILIGDAAQRVLPYRVQWAVAIVLALLGGAIYLLWPNDQWWFYAALGTLPLCALAWQREERLREERGDPERTPTGFADGPWGPP
jgi:hypothetical protein